LGVAHLRLLLGVTHLRLLLGVTHLGLLLLLLRVTHLGLLHHRLLLRVAHLGLLHHRLLLRVAHLGLLHHRLLLRVAHLRLLHHRLLLRVSHLWLLHHRLLHHRLLHHRSLHVVVCGYNFDSLGLVLSNLTIGEHDLWWGQSFIGVSLHQLLTVRCPLRTQVDGSRLLALILDIEPLIKTSTDTQTGQFDDSLSHELRTNNILIEDLHSHVITDILNIDVHILTGPLGFLALIVGSLGADTLLTRVNDHVRVHLAESFGITGELGLHDVHSEFA